MDSPLLDSINIIFLRPFFDRFIPQSVAENYDLDIPDYKGVDQIAEVSGTGTEARKEEVVRLAERQG